MAPFFKEVFKVLAEDMGKNMERNGKMDKGESVAWGCAQFIANKKFVLPKGAWLGKVLQVFLNCLFKYL